MINWNRGLLMAPNDGGEGSAPLPPVQSATPPALQPATSEPTPEAAPPVEVAPVAPQLSMTKEQLDARMEQVRRAQLRDLGFENSEELTAMRDRDAAATKAAEDERRAQQTREQQLTEDVAVATRERDAAQAEADDLRFQGHVASICATQGVTNIDYAQFEIQRASDAVPDGEQLDVEAWLKERMDPENAEHANLRTALGVAVPVATVQVPYNTSPGRQAPQPPPAGGSAPTAPDVFKQSAQEWENTKARLGV